MEPAGEGGGAGKAELEGDFLAGQAGGEQLVGATASALVGVLVDGPAGLGAEQAVEVVLAVAGGALMAIAIIDIEW